MGVVKGDKGSMEGGLSHNSYINWNMFICDGGVRNKHKNDDTLSI